MAIWLEPVRGGHPDASFGSLSGYELLREQLSGERFPKPPLAHLTGLRIVEVERGSVVFELPLTGWLRSPQGAISIGPMTIPADAALALAILSTLGPGVRLTTSELSLRVLAPARPEGRLIARASLMHTRRTIGLSEVTVTDEHGRLLAHGTSLCFIIEHAPGPSPDATQDPTPGAAAAAAETPSTPDPWRREPEGTVIDQATWDRLSGLEVAQGLIAGELPQPPIHHLIGLETHAVTDGAATFALPATRWLCAPPPGRLQGGTVALLAESALSTAIQTTLPPATALAPIDLKVNFLRPALADGRDLIAHGRVTHRGRRLAVANAEVLDADKRRVALATGSAMILPGRPATL
jgi:uncharacterized protein (TIGR00369 family)